jgi:hypothetical protein
VAITQLGTASRVGIAIIHYTLVEYYTFAEGLELHSHNPNKNLFLKFRCTMFAIGTFSLLITLFFVKKNIFFRFCSLKKFTHFGNFVKSTQKKEKHKKNLKYLNKTSQDGVKYVFSKIFSYKSVGIKDSYLILNSIVHC